MNELKDQPIEQGTRKRTEYENARRARLALNIERTDGGMLQIVVETDMRSNEEEPEIQQNTFLAVVPMALMKELNVSHDKVNVNGGACALGHPIGASGARIMVTLIHALKARGLKKGLATLCIGGGEGTAVALELV